MNILKQHLLAVYERHGPHLTLPEVDALDYRVRQAMESDLMWAPWIVRDRAELVIPDLAIAIESPDAVAVHVDLVAAEDERSGLVLVAHGKRMIEPVRDVGAPEKCTADVDFDVCKAGDVHHCVHMVLTSASVSASGSTTAR